MATQTGWPTGGVSHRHALVAVIACLLSLGLHFGGVVLLTRLGFDISVARFHERELENRKSTRVRSVERDPRPQPAVQRDRGEGGVPQWDDEPAVALERLGLAPRGALTEPPSLTDESLSERPGPAPLTAELPEREDWIPRQEIMVIEREVVADELLSESRRRVSSVGRVPLALDVVTPIDRKRIDGAGKAGTGLPAGARPSPADISPVPVGLPEVADPDLELGERPVRHVPQLEVEQPEIVTPFKPIEDLLVAGIKTYTTVRDREYGYFRIDIERAGAEVLPVIPKDLLLVQDSSASLAEQRMYFCRKGLTACLEQLRDGDRFNVVSFRTGSEWCFPDWAETEPANLRRAQEFVAGLRAEGNTDIFASIRDLVDARREPGRPVIALLLTDGRATAGLLDSSDIIGEFTKANGGAISVFAMGVSRTAEKYLLDLLSYCNRGESSLVEGGRWGIDNSLLDLMRQVSRPVLGELRFVFPQDSGCLVYPEQTANLYLDRPLVLYGRYPRDTRRVVFQVVGKAGETVCDMVFELDLDNRADRGGREIRISWAQQRIYHLIGRQARNPDPELIREIQAVSNTYKVPVPYRGKF